MADNSHLCIDLKTKYKDAHDVYETAKSNQLYDIAADALRDMVTISNSYYSKGCRCQFGDLFILPPPPNLSGTPGN